MHNHPLAHVTPEQLAQLDIAFGPVPIREVQTGKVAGDYPAASRRSVVDSILDMANRARFDAIQLRQENHQLCAENMGLKQAAARLRIDLGQAQARLTLAVRQQAGPDADRRALICVGACVGLSTAALEAGALGRLVSAAASLLARHKTPARPECRCDACVLEASLKALAPGLLP